MIFTEEELLEKQVNGKNKERVLGRYYASELNTILKGYVKPENFFKPRRIEENKKEVMYGMDKELCLANTFHELNINCLCGKEQAKYELKVDDEITIVTKPDFLFPEMTWETKAPINWNDFTRIKPSYVYQLECEYRATKRKTYLGYFSSEQYRRLPILVEYLPSDETWNEIVKKIKLYHNKIKKLYDNKNI